MRLGRSWPSKALIRNTGALFGVSGPNYTLSADTGIYTLSGQTVGITAQRKLVLAQGAYALTGQAVITKASRTLTLAQGSYSLTGQSVSLVYNVTHSLPIGQGSYALSGQTVTLTVAGRRLSLDTGSYGLTGSSVALTYSSQLYATAFTPSDTLDEHIDDLVVGDDYDVTREITGIPSGALLTDAWFTLKAFGAATTDTALIEKTISASASASQGQITDTGASGTGQLFFSLSATETALITPDQLYEYDIQVLSNTGKYSTREKGLLLAIAQITV
jgi:hypothetical protein